MTRRHLLSLSYHLALTEEAQGDTKEISNRGKESLNTTKTISDSDEIGGALVKKQVDKGSTDRLVETKSSSATNFNAMSASAVTQVSEQTYRIETKALEFNTGTPINQFEMTIESKSTLHSPKCTTPIEKSFSAFNDIIAVSGDEDCLATQRQSSELHPESTVPSSPSIRCPTCGKNLTYINEHGQILHANACLDQLEEFERNKLNAKQLKTQESTNLLPNETHISPPILLPCIVCGIELNGKSTPQRVNHTKQCGRRFGVNVQSLRTDSDAAPETTELEVIPISLPPNRTNAFDVLMKGGNSASVDTPTSSGTNAFDMLMKGANSAAVAAPRINPNSSNNKKRKTNQWSKPKEAYPCPQYKIIKGTKIVVDGFQYSSASLSSVYFLSHFHSDHYTGLTKSFSAGMIYCTPVTAKLVLLCLGVKAKFVHPIPFNQPYTLPDQQARVTFLDANHCPGAALILFELRGGKSYLHTGDFRYDPSMLSSRFLERYVHQSPVLDGVYLDTTYCDIQYCHPPQSVAIAEAKRLVDSHANDRALFLFGSYSIGKERLYMDAARHLNQKVYVERSKWSLIACFEWPETDMAMLTMEPSITNIHVVPMGSLNFEVMGALLSRHRLRFRKVIAFQPTGWTFSGKHKMSTKRSQQNDNLIIYGIPYSEHSSFEELCQFIKAFQPASIIPTVNCTKSQKQVDLLKQTCFNNLTHHFKG